MRSQAGFRVEGIPDERHSKRRTDALRRKRSLAMKVKIEKWGDGLGIRLPSELVADSGLSKGQVVEISVKNDAVELQKASPIRRYSLEELVAQMKPENEPPLVDWGPDVGAEILPEDEYSRGEITLDDLLKKKSESDRSV